MCLQEGAESPDIQLGLTRDDLHLFLILNRIRNHTRLFQILEKLNSIEDTKLSRVHPFVLLVV